MCEPIFKLSREKLILVLTPLPRYVGAPCCDDPNHTTNRGAIDFYSNMKDGLETVRIIVQEYLVRKGYRSARVVDPNLSVKGHSAEAIWGKEAVDTSNKAVELIRDSIKKVEVTAAGSLKRKTDEGLSSTAKRERARPMPSTHNEGEHWDRNYGSRSMYNRDRDHMQHVSWRRGGYHTPRGRG